MAKFATIQMQTRRNELPVSMGRHEVRSVKRVIADWRDAMIAAGETIVIDKAQHVATSTGKAIFVERA
jgi:hypothetical protein